LILNPTSDLNNLLINQLAIYEIDVVITISSASCTFIDLPFSISTTLAGTVFPNLQRVSLTIKSTAATPGTILYL